MRRFKHVKRGTTYEEIGRGELQSSFTISEGSHTLVVYRAEKDGTIWIRPAEEFDDGRFVLIGDETKHDLVNAVGLLFLDAMSVKSEPSSYAKAAIQLVLEAIKKEITNERDHSSEGRSV